MSHYQITYTDPSIPAEEVDAKSYDYDNNGDFIDFVDGDTCVFSVATRGVLSIKLIEEKSKSTETTFNVHNLTAVDVDELMHALDKVARHREALKYVK